MSSTPMYHPDDDETNPLPEDQGTARSQERSSDEQSGGESTKVEDLNDDGVGGTLGAKDTFEPEESDESHGSATANGPQH